MIGHVAYALAGGRSGSRSSGYTVPSTLVKRYGTNQGFLDQALHHPPPATNLPPNRLQGPVASAGLP